MYRTVAQIDSAQDLLARFFPQLLTRVTLPEPSVEKRPIHALRMRAGGGTASRRAVLIAGGTHARELMNPDAIIELVIDLILSYLNGTDIRYGGRTWPANDVKVILEAMDIWFLPCVNPDGRHFVLNTDDMWRKNRRDNPGTPCDGVDLNRNADVVWGVAQGQTSCSPCTDIYCGPSAFSEPETRNVKHLLDTQRVVTFVDVHSYSELVLYPWGHAPTQSTDATKRFTTIPGGTCTASIPATYSEYMPPRDVQRFQTVAGRIVADVAAVRGRSYTPQTSRALYATTGTQADYAYSRHIANPSLYKTYGFTFETGPFVGNAADSFHPADPTLIKRDAKAAMLALMQQSVCAIEIIGSSLFTGNAELAAMRKLRDQTLAATAAGRQWIALFERIQFAALLAAKQNPQVMALAGEVVQSAARLLRDDAAVFTAADAKRAGGLVAKLKAAVKIKALRDDLDALRVRITEVQGRPMAKVLASLARSKPALARSAKPKAKPASKPSSKPKAKAKAKPVSKRAAAASKKPSTRKPVAKRGTRRR